MKKRQGLTLVSAGLVAGLVLGSVGISYAASDTGTSPVPGAGVRMGQAMRDAGARLVDIVAGLTGLSVEDVQAQRAEGQSIADIAEANGVETDVVVDSALAARKAILDSKVADGTLTQDQADELYQQMAERLAERVTTDEYGCPAWAGAAGSMGGRGGRGGQGGPGLRDGSCMTTD